MVNRKRLVAVLIAIALVLPAAGASAGSRIGFQGMFGLGGEYEFKGGDDDAEATLGFGVFYENEFFRYFHFGLNVHFLWFNSESADDADVDRSTYIDISPFLKGRYPIFGDKGELYVKVPVGFTIAIPSDDLEDRFGYETGVGFNIGVLGGFGYKVFSSISAHVEMGWTGRFTKHDLKGGGDTKLDLNQFQMNFGVAYHF